MDRQELARNALRNASRLAEQLSIICAAELAEELVQILPDLIERGLCSFETSNRPCEVFSAEGVQAEHGNLYLSLAIKAWKAEDSNKFFVNFAGLMQRVSNPKLAAKIVDQMMKQNVVAKPLCVTPCVTPADAYAVRTYCPRSSVRARIELEAVYSALRGPVAVDLALRTLPSAFQKSTHRAPANLHLVPVVEYLRSMKVSVEGMKSMLTSLFDDSRTLCSLSKAVAIAGAYQAVEGEDGGDLLEFLRFLHLQRSHLVKLHFAGDSSTILPSGHIGWLRDNGLFDDLKEGANDRLGKMLVPELAQGKLVAVYQFLFHYFTNTKLNSQRRAALAKGFIWDWLPEAFTVAKQNGAYGIAAALASSVETISDHDRLEAIKMSVVFNQRISLDWQSLLLMRAEED